MYKIIRDLFPLAVVILCIAWLAEAFFDFVRNDDVKYLRELLGVFLATAGLNAYLKGSIELIKKLLYGVTLIVHESGRIDCSDRQMKRLAKHLRSGQSQLIEVKCGKLGKNNSSRPIHGINDKESAFFRDCIVEFSERCNLMMVPQQSQSQLLTDEDIAVVCIGLLTLIYDVGSDDSLMLTARSACSFNPWGVSFTGRYERPIFEFGLPAKAAIFTDLISDADRVKFLGGLPRDLNEFPKCVLVESFLPALIRGALLYKERIETYGGVIEHLEQEYWLLSYWQLELSNPVSEHVLKAARYTAKHEDQMKKFYAAFPGSMEPYLPPESIEVDLSSHKDRRHLVI